MIPVLHQPLESDFDSLGIGPLSDAMSCVVTEELNGIYELTMTYPITGKYFRSIVPDAIITAPNNSHDKPQPFRIHTVRPSLTGASVTIQAEHIGYQLRHIPVTPFMATTTPVALAAISKYALMDCPFTFETDIEADAGHWDGQGSTHWFPVPRSARSVLCDASDSIATVSGGELEFDRYRVILHGARGADRGVRAVFGVNLQDLQLETSITNLVTAVMPYWYKDSIRVMGSVQSLSTQYSYPRAKIWDATSLFETAPTSDQLNTAAAEWLSTQTAEALVSMSTAFIPLWQIADYATRIPPNTLRLADTITVLCPPLGLNVKAKITRTVYNVLTEKYDAVGVGSPRPSLDRTLAELIRQAN